MPAKPIHVGTFESLHRPKPEAVVNEVLLQSHDQRVALGPVQG
jgi:hypothetical protein